MKEVILDFTLRKPTVAKLVNETISFHMEVTGSSQGYRETTSIISEKITNCCSCNINEKQTSVSDSPVLFVENFLLKETTMFF